MPPRRALKSNSKSKDAKYRALLIDGSSLTVQMFYALGGGPLLDLGSEEEIISLIENSIDETIKRILTRKELDKFTHVRLALESPVMTFRYDIYSDYKGAFTQQKPRLAGPMQPALFYKAMQNGIECTFIDRYEADDVLAVMTQLLIDNGWLDHSTIHIWSTDTDLHQLVTEEGIYILGNKGVELSYVDIKDRWGLEPTAIPWIKALAGDASDNIKGFPGIGPKKAASYLRYVPHRKPTPWTLDMSKIPAHIHPAILHLQPRLARDELLCTLRRKGELKSDYEYYLGPAKTR